MTAEHHDGVGVSRDKTSKEDCACNSEAGVLFHFLLRERVVRAVIRGFWFMVVLSRIVYPSIVHGCALWIETRRRWLELYPDLWEKG